MIMNDAEDSADTAFDAERHSRRDRWKDAISKTKSRWKKEKGLHPQSPPDFKLSDDVNDFLAAGRRTAGITTIRPATPPPVDDPSRRQISPRPSTSESRNSGQPSPRGVPVPRLDVSQTRWPNSRPVPDDLRSRSDDHLTPHYSASRTHYERSHSFNSALAKKRTKPRGLSVTFTDHPPTIIGEGGDMAEAPPCEISRARHQRSRSLSPYLERPASLVSNNSSNNSRSPVRRKPVPSPGHSPGHSPNHSLTVTPTSTLFNSDREDSMFQPRPVRRIQTGFNGQEVRTPLVTKTSQDVQDFEKHLQQAPQLRGTAQNIQSVEQPPQQPPQLTETSKDVRDFEQQLQHALNLGGDDGRRDSEVDPFTDPRAQQVRMPAPQPLRPVDQPRYPDNVNSAQINNQPSTVNSRAPANYQQRISPTSPPSHPGLQQRVSPVPPQSRPDVQHHWSPSPPHHHHHPDLQQSTETSHKAPPPRVSNFYADVNRRNSSPEQKIEKRPFAQHVQELNMKSPPRSPPDHHNQVRQNHGSRFEEPTMRSLASQQKQPPPPGGWI